MYNCWVLCLSACPPCFRLYKSLFVEKLSVRIGSRRQLPGNVWLKRGVSAKIKINVVNIKQKCKMPLGITLMYTPHPWLLLSCIIQYIYSFSSETFRLRCFWDFICNTFIAPLVLNQSVYEYSFISGIKILSLVPPPWEQKASAYLSSQSVNYRVGQDVSAAKTLPSFTPCLVVVTKLLVKAPSPLSVNPPFFKNTEIAPELNQFGDFLSNSKNKAINQNTLCPSPTIVSLSLAVIHRLFCKHL